MSLLEATLSWGSLLCSTDNWHSDLGDMSSTLPNPYTPICKVSAVKPEDSEGEYFCSIWRPGGVREVRLSYRSEQIFPGPTLGPGTGARHTGVGKMA